MKIEHVFVSSTRRGFLAIVGWPSVTDGPCGTSSGTGLLFEIGSVTWNGSDWDISNRSLWTRKAWNDAIALTGAEPWRIYKLNANEVAEALDSGEHIDDIRGFENRCELWQPMKNGEYVKPAEATVWVRDDGWRIILRCDGRWYADGSECNADEKSTLEYSPNHFEPLLFSSPIPEAAKCEVDAQRPWE